MARRLESPNRSGGCTDHSPEITSLRQRARKKERYDALVYELCADLLVAHDESGISLDGWKTARDLVELLIGGDIIESGV
jgi:hypothetical protein